MLGQRIGFDSRLQEFSCLGYGLRFLEQMKSRTGDHCLPGCGVEFEGAIGVGQSAGHFVPRRCAGLSQSFGLQAVDLCRGLPGLGAGGVDFECLLHRCGGSSQRVSRCPTPVEGGLGGNELENGSFFVGVCK